MSSKRFIFALAGGILAASMLSSCATVFLYSLSGFGPNINSSKKIYKDYTERSFVIEAVKDRDAESNDLNFKPGVIQGDFVVIPVIGPISDITYQDVFDQLLIATRYNLGTKAVIFYVSSPGGTVTASDNLYAEIRKLKARGIKTVTYVDGLSASGAYYITANSDKMIASPVSIVGSIGVIFQLYNFEELAGKIGIRSETIKSADMKDIGSPFKKMSVAERQVIQDIVDDSFNRFVDIVKDGRKMGQNQVRRVTTGAVWTAKEAKNLGLVDEVAYMRQAVEITKQLTGVANPRLVIYQREASIFDLFKISLNTFSELNPEKITERLIPPPQLLYQWIP